MGVQGLERRGAQLPERGRDVSRLAGLRRSVRRGHHYRVQHCGIRHHLPHQASGVAKVGKFTGVAEVSKFTCIESLQ